MRVLMEAVHNAMHGFVNMGGAHISFRDPFVFLLHSNVDRLFARWQTDPAHPERLIPNTVYGSESGDPELNGTIAPWAGTPPTVRPFAPPENQQVAKTYKDPSVVAPPRYDTNFANAPMANKGSQLSAGQFLAVNDYLVSPGGKYFAIMQGGWQFLRLPRGRPAKSGSVCLGIGPGCEIQAEERCIFRDHAE